MIQVFLFQLPETCNESAIHVKNVKVLMTKIYQFLNDISPSIMNDIFQKARNLLLSKKPKVPSF